MWFDSAAGSVSRAALPYTHFSFPPATSPCLHTLHTLSFFSHFEKIPMRRDLEDSILPNLGVVDICYGDITTHFLRTDRRVRATQRQDTSPFSSSLSSLTSISIMAGSREMMPRTREKAPRRDRHGGGRGVLFARRYLLAPRDTPCACCGGTAQRRARRLVLAGAPAAAVCSILLTAKRTGLNGRHSTLIYGGRAIQQSIVFS